MGSGGNSFEIIGRGVAIGLIRLSVGRLADWGGLAIAGTLGAIVAVASVESVVARVFLFAEWVVGVNGGVAEFVVVLIVVILVVTVSAVAPAVAVGLLDFGFIFLVMSFAVVAPSCTVVTPCSI